MITDLKQHCTKTPERISRVYKFIEIDGEYGMAEYWNLQCCGEEYTEFYQFWPHSEWLGDNLNG